MIGEIDVRLCLKLEYVESVINRSNFLLRLKYLGQMIDKLTLLLLSLNRDLAR